MPSANPAELRKKHFSVDEANRMLPLVRKIVGDIVEQFRVVSDLQQRLAPVLGRDKRRRQADVYSEELAHSRAELEAEEAKLAEFREELADLGVELKSPDGLCDFPAVLGGREVYLCWRLGEPEVQFWHGLKEGFAGRQPLPTTPVNRINPGGRGR